MATAAQNKKWKEANPEKSAAAYDKYHGLRRVADNAMLKCTTCGDEKIATDFQWKYKEKGIRSNQCRLCQGETNRKSYANNKIVRAAAANKSKNTVKEEVTKKILEYLLIHPCVDCGEARPLRLTFDHVRGKKEFCISNAIRRGISWNKISTEIDKCDIRCANCHHEKTAITGKFLMAKMLRKAVL